MIKSGSGASSSFDPIRDAWEERSAIMEFDGGLTRRQAETAAAISMGIAPGAMRHIGKGYDQ